MRYMLHMLRGTWRTTKPNLCWTRYQIVCAAAFFGVLWNVYCSSNAYTILLENSTIFQSNCSRKDCSNIGRCLDTCSWPWIPTLRRSTASKQHSHEDYPSFFTIKMFATESCCMSMMPCVPKSPHTLCVLWSVSVSVRNLVWDYLLSVVKCTLFCICWSMRQLMTMLSVLHHLMPKFYFFIYFVVRVKWCLIRKLKSNITCSCLSCL